MELESGAFSYALASLKLTPVTQSLPLTLHLAHREHSHPEPVLKRYWVDWFSSSRVKPAEGQAQCRGLGTAQRRETPAWQQ